MISLSVVKIHVNDKKYMLTRKELQQVRELLGGIKSDNARETDGRLQELLKDTHIFENKREYTLFIDTLKLDEGFFVWSERRTLTEMETAQITKLVNCAISAPNTLLVFPDYIMISSNPPPGPVKKPRKKKGKDDAK